MFVLLGTCAGCAMFRPVQLHPDEWKYLDEPAARRLPLTDAERRELSRLPADLEEAISWTTREYQRLFVMEHAALSVPQHIGNFLIGLTSFGVYRGVTHPSMKTTAGVAALGTAAYAAGTAVDWKGQAGIFSDARAEFLCLIGEGEKYLIQPARDARATAASTGRMQLQEAGTAVRDKSAVLDALLARHASLNGQYLASAATVRKSACPDAAPDPGLCTPPPGTEGAIFRQKCRVQQARRAALCATSTTPAVYSAPAPEVAAAFAYAGRVRGSVDADLLRSARITAVSHRARLPLWRMAETVRNNASKALQPTGTDLANVLEALKAGQQPKASGLVTGKAQSGQFADIPLNARTRTRTLDVQASGAVAAIEAATRELDGAHTALSESLAANSDVPLQLDESKFEACLSPEVKLAKALMPTPSGAEPPASGTLPQDGSEKPLSEANDAELAELGLPRGAPNSDIETRLRTCQRTRELPVDGRLTGSMQRHLREGVCRGIAWQ